MFLAAALARFASISSPFDCFVNSDRIACDLASFARDQTVRVTTWCTVEVCAKGETVGATIGPESRDERVEEVGEEIGNEKKEVVADGCVDEAMILTSRWKAS
jgi:hypothetical protein